MTDRADGWGHSWPLSPSEILWVHAMSQVQARHSTCLFLFVFWRFGAFKSCSFPLSSLPSYTFFGQSGKPLTEGRGVGIQSQGAKLISVYTACTLLTWPQVDGTWSMLLRPQAHLCLQFSPYRCPPPPREHPPHTWALPIQASLGASAAGCSPAFCSAAVRHNVLLSPENPGLLPGTSLQLLARSTCKLQQQLVNFFSKGPDSKSFRLVGHMVPIATIQLCHDAGKQP